MENHSQTPPPAPGIQDDQNTWAMLAHLSAFVGVVGVPFGNIIGPLIVWIIKKDTMPLVDDQGRESLNFQISMTIYLFLCFLLAFVIIGFILLPVVAIFDIVLTIIAAVNAQKGVAYRYPLTIRFL